MNTIQDLIEKTQTSQNLKELRIKAGLSAEAVAATLKKSVSTIRHWESGTHEPTLHPQETLALCKLYQCSLEQLAISNLKSQQKFQEN